MTAEKINPRRVKASRITDEQVKDEVYRHMFRLEARRPGADLDLAVALLRAWLASDFKYRTPAIRGWLKQVCPICLAMIEAARCKPETGQQCIQ